MLEEGLYEQVISKELEKKLNKNNDIKYDASAIDNAEAPAVLSRYVAEIVQKGLTMVQGDDISEQLGLVNKIISVITEATGDEDFDGSSVEEKARQLMAVVKKKNNIAAITDAIDIPRPKHHLQQAHFLQAPLMSQA